MYYNSLCLSTSQRIDFYQLYLPTLSTGPDNYINIHTCPVNKVYLLRGMLFYRNQQIIIAWWQNKKFQYYWLIILYILSNLSNSDQKLKYGHHIFFSVILKFAWSTIFSQFKSMIIIMITSTWVKFN